MFCPVCGAKVVEGAAFCDSCGSKITENQSTPVVPQTPEQPIVQEFGSNPQEPIVPNFETNPSFQAPPPMNMPPMPTYAIQPKLKKGKYIKQIGSKKVKALSKIVWAVFLALVIVLGLGAYNIVGAGVEEIPVVTMVVPEKEMKEIEKVKDEAVELLDKADDALEEVKSEISNEEYKMLKDFIKDAKAFAQTPSIANIKNMISRFEEVSKTAEKYTDNEDMKEIKEKIDSVDIIEELAEPMKIIDVATYILFGFAGIIALFLLLATALKSNGLTIFCMILSAPILYFIAGPVYCVLGAVLFIGLIVMFSMINSEYKKYRKGV